MVKVCDTFSGPVGSSAGGEFDEKGEARLSREPRKGGGDAGTALIPRTRTQTRRPHMYRVLLLNEMCIRDSSNRAHSRESES